MADEVEPIARWDFESEAGWQAAHQCRITQTDGILTVEATGRDPQLVTPVQAKAGWKCLRVRARIRGRAAGQVFWTTTADPATSEERSVTFDWRFKDNEFHDYAVFFRPDAPLTSLRFDPGNRRIKMDVEWIALSEEAPPPPQATPVKDVRVPEGFRVELLYSVPSADQGSWVSLTHDGKGRLITSDQYGKLYRVTPAAKGRDTTIEPIDVEVGMAQGLLYAFDSLYVMVNGTDREKQGLYRVRDTDGDDKFDTVEHLRKLAGGGEHGPHAVILSPDGKSLYVCCGNHTDPTDFAASRVPQNWKEDQLLPRMWDAGGHAVGRMAPGGWIAKTDPQGREWELIGCGFRNEYDIAFNMDGELFTYDADMEWDVGSPWYRPTRVNHVSSGAEFGWRSGTGKWPTWYPDSLPAVVDIGPGSPTGITFGTGAKFPAKFQQALFISDWSYGIIYAVHMTPDGSTYTGTAEQFVAAAPLPVTDMVVNPADGALYFTIGGRRTQSGLYRVTYTGAESTAAVSPRADPGTPLRLLRHGLEELHYAGAPEAVSTAWPYLGHADRYIRYAARVAIEHQPVAQWQEQALSETHPERSINALLALVRNGDKALLPRVLQSLARLGDADLDERQLLDGLRVLSLAFIRLGVPADDMKAEIVEALNGMYPSESVRLYRELSALLVFLDAPETAAKTLGLLAQAPTQEEQIQYALWLRSLKSGWTPELRRAYFAWFNQTGALRGGHSFSGFLGNIRKEALESLSDDEQTALADVLNAAPKPVDPTAEMKARPIVRRWTVDDLLPRLESGLSGRDFSNGRRMFSMTACYKCHRFAGEGGIVGPDLTGAGRRFNNRDLLSAIIEPSKVISDQYQATTFVLENGRTVTGRIANLSGDTLRVIEDMLNPGNMTGVKRDEIDEMLPSQTSMMPTGLLDTLTENDILDLVAYLKAGGNSQHEVFEP